MRETLEPDCVYALLLDGSVDRHGVCAASDEIETREVTGGEDSVVLLQLKRRTSLESAVGTDELGLATGNPLGLRLVADGDQHKVGLNCGRQMYSAELRTLLTVARHEGSRLDRSRLDALDVDPIVENDLDAARLELLLEVLHASGDELRDGRTSPNFLLKGSPIR